MAKVIFTDLDGTLIDHETYACDEASEALAAVHRMRVPLCICSSKTRAEILAYQKRLAIRDPFIAENGGAVFIPSSDGFRVVEIGERYPTLIQEFCAIREELQMPLRAFHEITAEELAAVAGMAVNDARLALQREFDEPFWSTSAASIDADRLHAAAAARGLRISKGGRFFHLHGSSDKGQGVAILLDYFAETIPALTSAAVGDSPNDIPMLLRSDKRYLVQKPNGVHDPVVLSEVPGVIPIAGVGPKGWQIAITDFLEQGSEGSR